MNNFNFTIIINPAKNGGYSGYIGNMQTGGFAVGDAAALVTYLEANSTYLTSQQITDIKTKFGIA